MDKKTMAKDIDDKLEDNLEKKGKCIKDAYK